MDDETLINEHDETIAGVPAETHRLMVEIEFAIRVLNSSHSVPAEEILALLTKCHDFITGKSSMTLDMQARMLLNSMPELIDADGRPKKIQWIKELRGITGLGLKETKDIIDRVYKEMGH